MSTTRERVGSSWRRRRRRPGSARPSDRTGNGIARVVRHPEFSAPFLVQSPPAEIKAGPCPGRVSGNRSVYNTCARFEISPDAGWGTSEGAGVPRRGWCARSWSGVVIAQHPHAVGQGLLEQRDSPFRVPRRLVGAGEVVPRGQGVGMVGAQQPRIADGGTLVVLGHAAGLALTRKEHSGLDGFN